MCVSHSNGIVLWIFSQEEEVHEEAKKCHEKMMARGQKIHWLWQMALVSKLHICIFECCLP